MAKKPKKCKGLPRTLHEELNLTAQELHEERDETREQEREHKYIQEMMYYAEAVCEEELLRRAMVVVEVRTHMALTRP